ncbi:ABC transporter ATP-binding protein [Propionibacteriaceae bacterium Y2011]
MTDAPGSAVIETVGLVKTFGRHRALDGLDLVVGAGEVHGFLGPNGAGKSTTLRLLLGLLRATAGRVSVFGQDPWREAVPLHRRMAAVPGDVTLWPNLSGGEAIDLLTRLRNPGRDADAVVLRRRTELLEAFDLDPGRKCRTYSKGNRQKVALIAAFGTPAELYLLDEPTSGLDPLMEQVFRSEVRRAAASGATVLLSSHLLAEVEQLCDRVSIIRDGRMVDSGTLADLRHLSHTVVHYRGTPLTDHRIHDLVVDGDQVRCRVAESDLSAVLSQLAVIGASNLIMAPPSLEDLFMAHYAPAPVVGGGRR